jgi:hypothetical protein
MPNDVQSNGDDFWILKTVNSHHDGILMLHTDNYKSPNWDGEVFLAPKWTTATPSDWTYRIINSEVFDYDMTIAEDITPTVFNDGSTGASFVPVQLYPDGQWRGQPTNLLGLFDAFQTPFDYSFVRSNNTWRNVQAELVLDGSWVDITVKFRMPDWDSSQSLGTVLSAIRADVGWKYLGSTLSSTVNALIEREVTTNAQGETTIALSNRTGKIIVPTTYTSTSVTDHTFRVRSELSVSSVAGPLPGLVNVTPTITYDCFWDTYLIDTYTETLPTRSHEQEEDYRLWATTISNNYGCPDQDYQAGFKGFDWAASVLGFTVEGNMIHNSHLQP